MFDNKSLILDNKENINIKNDLAVAEKVFEYSNNIFYLQPQKYFSASDFIYNSFRKYKGKIVDEDHILYETLIEFGNDYTTDFINDTFKTFFHDDLIKVLKDNRTITFFEDVTVNVLTNKGFRGVLKQENFSLKDNMTFYDLLAITNKTDDEKKLIKFVLSYILKLLKENKNIIIYLFDLCLFRRNDKNMFVFSHNLLKVLNEKYNENIPLKTTSVN